LGRLFRLKIVSLLIFCRENQSGQLHFTAGSSVSERVGYKKRARSERLLSQSDCFILTDKDRDVFRFFGISDLDPCASSPFLLGATLQEHLSTLEQKYPETVAELRNDLYVDDVISGGTCEQEVTKVKEEAKEIFDQGGFTLHKWHCSVASLEEPENNRHLKIDVFFANV
jgi:hypothetical protein